MILRISENIDKILGLAGAWGNPYEDEIEKVYRDTRMKWSGGRRRKVV